MTVDLALVVAAVERAGYGRGEPEVRFDPVRRWRFDWAWPDLRVAFEREGMAPRGGKSRHTTFAGYGRDAEKYNAAAIAGWLVVRATADMIRSGLALNQLLAALAVRSGGQT